MLYNALEMTFQQFKIRRNPKCPMCGDHPTINKLIDYEQFCGIRRQEAATPADAVNTWETTVEDLKRRLDQQEKLFILDVRNPEEFEICRIPGSILIPLPELPQRFQQLDADKEWIVHCKSGMRSLKATQFLRAKGFQQVKNLKGGILAWADKIDPAMPKY
jgi:adenylyltransferase/sulfurtransferase